MLRRGFSLLELLVVVATRADCQNRMRQLGLAAHGYHATHRHFPEGVAYPFSKTETETHSRHAGLSWHTSLLPHLEQDELWRRAWAAHTAKPSGESPDHAAVAAHPIPAFRCPTDARSIGRYDYEPAATEDPPWGLTNYLGVSGTGIHNDDGVLHPKLKVSTSGVTDGTSNTVMIGERPTDRSGYHSGWYSGWGTLRYFGGQLLPVDEEWANTQIHGQACEDRTVFHPGKYDDPCHHSHFWSLHPGGGNFAFADGSVRFLRYSAASVLPALATRAGGESVSVD